MLIKIAYESKYSLATVKNGESVLTGMAVITDEANRNVKDLFKKENSFLQNIKELNKYYPNYQYADITQNTVLGILCRLVGEVRRLDTLNDEHPILLLKERITFKNENREFQNEVVLLHTPLKEVQNNAGGVIPDSKSGHFLLTRNPLSETLLSIFQYKTQLEIVNFLNGMKKNDPSLFHVNYNGDIKANTFVKEHSLSDANNGEVIVGLDFFDGLKRLKEINGRLFYGDSEKVQELEIYIKTNMILDGFKPALITEERKKLNVDEIFNIWGFLFAKKISFLRKNELFSKEFESSLNTSKSSIKGLAPGSGSITIKDFYTNFVTDKKMSWTMPYSVEIKRELFVKEDLPEFNSRANLGITKECGDLTIKLDLTKEEELDLYERIETAGVNSFHLGKKGLAYVSNIILEKI